MVVDDLVRAKLLDEIKVSRTRGGDDLEPGELGKLERKQSDGSGTTVNEDPFGAVGLGGRVGQAETGVQDLCGCGETYAVRRRFPQTDGSGRGYFPEQVALYSGVLWAKPSAIVSSPSPARTYQQTTPCP